MKKTREMVPAQTADADPKLMAMLGNGKKPSKMRKLLIAGGVLLVAAAAAVFFFLLPDAQQADADTVYREYAVEYGDIVVGQTESSSVSLKRETVTFPVSAEVEEIYVKAGSSVKQGDPLMRLNLSDIETSLKSYELQLEIAGLELEQNKLQLETKLLQAKQKLETSKEAGSLARETKNTNISELQLALTKSENALASAQKELANYTNLSATFESDYRTLKSLENSVSYLEDEVTRLQTSVSGVSDYSSALTSAKANLTSTGTLLTSIATALDADTGFTSTPTNAGAGAATALAKNMISYYNYYIAGTLSDASIPALVGGLDPASASAAVSAWASSAAGDTQTNLNSFLSTLGNMGSYAQSIRSYTSSSASATSDRTNLESQLASAKSALSSYQSAYSDYKEYYSDKYGSITGAEEIADKIITLETDVETAKINLSKADLSAQTGATSAEQTQANALTEAGNASALYELTEMELAQAVDSAQEAYNDLLSQIEDVKSMLTEDGTVLAPCNGMVSSLSVAAGDRVSVNYNSETKKISEYAQLLVMTNISDIYVPITISEEDILSVSIGQEATVAMNAFADHTFEATVDTISVEAARVGAATISYTVTVLFSEKNEMDIYEGMSAEVTLVQRAVRGVLYINSQAVTNEDGKSTVLKQGEDGAGVVTEIKTGFSDGRYVEVVSGLQEGDVVLMESAVSAAGGRP